MTKSINRYFLSVFALTALLFVAACGSAAAPDPGNTTETSNSTSEQPASVSTGDTKDTEMDQPKDQGATPAEGTMDGTTQGTAQVATEGTTEGTRGGTTGRNYGRNYGKHRYRNRRRNNSRGLSRRRGSRNSAHQGHFPPFRGRGHWRPGSRD